MDNPEYLPQTNNAFYQLFILIFRVLTYPVEVLLDGRFWPGIILGIVYIVVFSLITAPLWMKLRARIGTKYRDRFVKNSSRN